MGRGPPSECLYGSSRTPAPRRPVPGDCPQGNPSRCEEFWRQFDSCAALASPIQRKTRGRGSLWDALRTRLPCSGATSDARCAMGETEVLIRKPYCWQNDTSSARALVNARNSDCARHRAHCWWRALASAMDRRPLSPLRIAPAPEPPSGSNRQHVGRLAGGVHSCRPMAERSFVSHIVT